jgi:dipeptidyl aminopeptidase/acylaminoacyl peptidase
MQKLGVRSDLHLYDGQPHEFYNKAKYLETLLEVDKFLSSLSYLSGPSTLMRPPKE